MISGGLGGRAFLRETVSGWSTTDVQFAQVCKLLVIIPTPIVPGGQDPNLQSGFRV